MPRAELLQGEIEERREGTAANITSQEYLIFISVLLLIQESRQAAQEGW